MLDALTGEGDRPLRRDGNRDPPCDPTPAAHPGAGQSSTAALEGEQHLSPAHLADVAVRLTKVGVQGRAERHHPAGVGSASGPVQCQDPAHRVAGDNQWAVVEAEVSRHSVQRVEVGLKREVPPALVDRAGEPEQVGDHEAPALGQVAPAGTEGVTAAGHAVQEHSGGSSRTGDANRKRPGPAPVAGSGLRTTDEPRWRRSHVAIPNSGIDAAIVAALVCLTSFRLSASGLMPLAWPWPGAASPADCPGSAGPFGPHWPERQRVGPRLG